jgi:hypothetical protein
MCTACEPGQFSSAMSATTCTACPAGSFASGAGATSCTPCAAGTAAAAGSATCTACASGTFSLGGAAACAACGSCDDQDPCTADACDATLGCTHTTSCTPDMGVDAGTSIGGGGGCSIDGSADSKLSGVWLLVAALVLLVRRRLQRRERWPSYSRSRKS